MSKHARLAGLVLMVVGIAAGLESTPSWTSPGTQTDELYGTVATSIGDVNGDGYGDVAVSAPNYSRTTPGDGQDGRVEVFHGGAGGLAAVADWTWIGGMRDGLRMGEQAGYTLASGDFNGDGFNDLVVGAHASSDPSPEFSLYESAEGRAYVFYGSASGLPVDPSWSVEGNGWAEMFGLGVAAGDLNGDGFADLIAGCPLYTIYYVGSPGRAFAWFGSATGLPTELNVSADMRPSIVPDWSSADIVDGTYFGGTMTTGDLNDDGYDDLVIDEWWGTNGESAEGLVYVYYGSAAGPSASYDIRLEADQADGGFGWGLACADVTGDDCDDLIIGAAAFDGGDTDEGRVYIYQGGAGGIGATADWTLECNLAGAYYGWSVGAEDVTGDGIADVLVGAPGYSNGETNEGAVFIYNGGVSGPSATADQVLEVNVAAGQLGTWVSGAGDTMDDGAGDVIVGAPYSEAGRAYVFYCEPDGPALPPVITPATLPGATFNVSYSHALTFVNGTSPDWAIQSGALPAGLTLSSTTGVISGTPIAANGVYAFTVLLTTSSGTDTESFGITVTGGSTGGTSTGGDSDSGGGGGCSATANATGSLLVLVLVLALALGLKR